MKTAVAITQRKTIGTLLAASALAVCTENYIRAY